MKHFSDIFFEGAIARIDNVLREDNPYSHNYEAARESEYHREWRKGWDCGNSLVNTLADLRRSIDANYTLTLYYSIELIKIQIRYRATIINTIEITYMSEYHSLQNDIMQIIDIHRDIVSESLASLRKLPVERDINKRWEQGIDHHPKSKELYKAIAKIDFELCNDYFCWKSGGDGDNGETLMYQLDIYFECLDRNEPL